MKDIPKYRLTTVWWSTVKFFNDFSPQIPKNYLKIHSLGQLLERQRPQIPSDPFLPLCSYWLDLQFEHHCCGCALTHNDSTVSQAKYGNKILSPSITQFFCYVDRLDERETERGAMKMNMMRKSKVKEHYSRYGLLREVDEKIIWLLLLLLSFFIDNKSIWILFSSETNWCCWVIKTELPRKSRIFWQTHTPRKWEAEGVGWGVLSVQTWYSDKTQIDRSEGREKITGNRKKSTQCHLLFT